MHAHVMWMCMYIYIYSIYSRPIIRRPIIRADLATFKPYPRKLFSFFSSKINMLKSLAISNVNVHFPAIHVSLPDWSTYGKSLHFHPQKSAYLLETNPQESLPKTPAKIPMGTKKIHLGYQKNPKNLNGSGLFSYLRGLPCQSSRGDPNDHCVDRILGPKNPLLFTTSTFLGPMPSAEPVSSPGVSSMPRWTPPNLHVPRLPRCRWHSPGNPEIHGDSLGIYLGFTGWKSINTVGWVGDFLLG